MLHLRHQHREPFGPLGGRETFVGIGGLTLGVLLLYHLIVQDAPGEAPRPAPTASLRESLAGLGAMLADPALLILDDALSAVDTRTEAYILDALQLRRGRRTTIVIAHRLSTLQRADRILVLDHGKVVQTGTHGKLVAQQGLYRELWQIQSSLEEDLSTDMQEV